MAKLVSKTYGQALFDLAVEENILDQIVEEETFVREVLKENEDLITLLNHPKITKDEKIKVVENVFKGKLSDTIVGFLVLIVNKQRNAELNHIFDYFEEKVREYKNIGVVSVTSAVELTEGQKEKLIERLLQVTSYKTVEMNYSVEPEILGGLIIRIGDRVVDSSLRSQVSSFSKELLKVQLS